LECLFLVTLLMKIHARIRAGVSEEPVIAKSLDTG
jgi:hypothetical protein